MQVVLGPVLDVGQLQASPQPSKSRWDAFSTAFGYLTQAVSSPAARLRV